MAGNSQIVSLGEFKNVCTKCNLHDLCLPLGLSGGEAQQLDAIVRRRRPLNKGDYVFRVGEPFQSLYAVRSGVVKTFTISANGEERITGFRFAGQLLGLDGIARGHHEGYARALDTTSLCEIPYERLDALSGKIPSLRHQLLRIMSREIVHEEQMLTRMAQLPAEQRLATFFVQLSQRFSLLGYSDRSFPLKISNAELGAFLGLAGETVSRLLSRFRAQSLVTLQKKHVQIHDIEGLRVTARVGTEDVLTLVGQSAGN